MSDQQREDNRYRSRKLRLAVGALAVATAFVPLGYISGVDWIRFAVSVLALYVAGNVGDTWVERG